jgi:hypothetical protein
MVSKGRNQAVIIQRAHIFLKVDEGLSDVTFRPALNTLIWLAFAAALITYTGFSFHVPENFFIAVE